jgi:dTDP-glucose 4,6-dehydratase/UDP-glucose 4-epimerase
VKKRETIRLFGTGNESRDFIYIGDLVQAIHQVALKAEMNGLPVNVANGKELLIKDCVSEFFEFFDHPVDHKFTGETRTGDPVNWKADIKLLKGLGYKQQFSLKQGLENYYQWITKNG